VSCYGRLKGSAEVKKRESKSGPINWSGNGIIIAGAGVKAAWLLFQTVFASGLVRPKDDFYFDLPEYSVCFIWRHTMVLVIGERGNFPWATEVQERRWRRNWHRTWLMVKMRGGSLERLKKFMPDHVVVNLLPPDSVRGSWNRRLAEGMKETVEKLFESPFEPYDCVVILGARLRKLFFGSVEFGHIGKIGCLPAVSIPHPSGVNRWWHRAGAMDQARKWVSNLLERRNGICNDSEQG
jgi:hypothetical protein